MDEKKESANFQPDYLIVNCQPYDLISLLINKRKLQLQTSHPSLPTTILDEKQDARMMSEMIVQKSPDKPLNRNNIYNELISHKLEFLKAAPNKPPIAKKTARPQTPPKEPTVQLLPPTSRRDDEENPYHYSRFQRNLNAYKLEYDVVQKHVKEK